MYSHKVPITVAGSTVGISFCRNISLDVHVCAETIIQISERNYLVYPEKDSSNKESKTSRDYKLGIGGDTQIPHLSGIYVLRRESEKLDRGGRTMQRPTFFI